MSHRIAWLGVGALLLFGAPLCGHAQGPAGPGSRGGFGQRGPGGPGGPGDFAFEGMIGNFGGRTVTGKPFSATITSEHTEKLQDGNTIDNTVTGSVARDASGRTHREFSLANLGPLSTSGQPAHIISITDPVAGMDYVLNVNKKTYQQFGIGRNGSRGGNSGNAPPTPRTRPGETVENLPGTTVNGVYATGTRITRTIPAGAIGNANPVVITDERWYSPDLQMVIMETHGDPRNGTTTFQLTNISQSEPDASLFSVPSGYSLEQGRRGPGAGRRGGAPPPPAGQD